MKFSACGGWFGTDNYNTYIKAAEKGFKGVEQLSWLGLDFKKARDIMEENDITSTAVVIQSENPEIMKQIAWSHGMVWEDTREMFITAFKETVKAAKALGVPNIIATTGNERFDVSREKQHEIVVETLKCLAPLAEQAGLMIILEPLNVLVDHKGYFLAKSDEAFKMIREIASPNVKLLFDIYHQQITEGNLIQNITKNIDLIGHFHIADVPGRKEPGTGEINYWNVFEAIEATDYNGWLAFECGRSLPIDELCDEMWSLIAPFSDEEDIPDEFLECDCDDCCGCGENQCDCDKQCDCEEEEDDECGCECGCEDDECECCCDDECDCGCEEKQCDCEDDEK